MYFVATESPNINTKRIQKRVKNGEHSVPEDKTIARYYRCIEQIKTALPYLNRAYFFNNTNDQLVFFSEYEIGKGVKLYSELNYIIISLKMPQWMLNI